MYRKTVWCYIFVLTLLDIIFLNTKLTAQGKSHDVTTVHDSLLEGITLQEWGGAETSGGAGGVTDALHLRPRALRFGRVPLAAAHRLTVTVTNLANNTVHLASVAGTTGDFHASFFDSKTLPPQGNTSFSVVYLGRREGPVSATLYLHTSLGVHKYQVSAEGVASEWGVWPLVGLSVPANSSLEPLLTLYNPTDRTVQVSEVYSSGSWVQLRLPGGGGAAAREAWRVPPRAARDLVRLRLRLPPHHPPPAAPRPRAAYVRIKGDMVGGAGSTLVVCVEAAPAPAGPYLLPPHIRLALRGADDPPEQWEVSAGNSGSTAAAVDAALWAARCGPAPPPHHHHPPQAHLNGDGGRDSGAQVTVLRPTLAAHQQPVPALRLTLDYGQLWAGYAGGRRAAGGAWCSGRLVWGGASLPYSVRLLPGTLRLQPADLLVVAGGEGGAAHVVRATNDLPEPIAVTALHPGPGLLDYFTVSELTPLVVGAGQAAELARLVLRPGLAATAQLDSHLAVHTNVSRYTLPVALQTGLFTLEWQWPNSADGTLRLGGAGAAWARRVGLRLRNDGARPLCALSVRLRAPALALHLAACTHADPKPDDPCRCVDAGRWAQAWLSVAAPAQAGAHVGELRLRTQHARQAAAVLLTVHAGRVRAAPLAAAALAPYVGWSTPLIVESTMAVGMRALRVDPANPPDPAFSFRRAGEGWVWAGRQRVGWVRVRAERWCRPRCYLGGHGVRPAGAGAGAGPGADHHQLAADLRKVRARRDMFAALPTHHINVSLYLHTTEVVQVEVGGSLRLQWPRLWAGGAEGGALAGAGGAARLRLRLANPARRPLLLRALLAPRPPDPLDPLHADRAETLRTFCETESCVWSEDAFRISEWRALGGRVTLAHHDDDGRHDTGDADDTDADDMRDPDDGGDGDERARPPPAPAEPFDGDELALVLAAGAAVEITVTFAPATADAFASYLYLRNNLTVVEAVPLRGRGAEPSFEVGGRRAGAGGPPLTLALADCGPARRALAVRNTGRAPLALADWRVAGVPCAARGWALAPCAPLTLAPNQTAALALAYAADHTLARAHAALTVRAHASRASFRLAALASPDLLRACARAAPRPPFEPPLRAAGAALALAALALALAAAALDAERTLRRARAARAPAPEARPFDLRVAAVIAAAPPETSAPPPARRRRPARRPPAAAAPRAPPAERRAFERWRARVLRRETDADAAPSAAEPTDLAGAPPVRRPEERSDGAGEGSPEEAVDSERSESEGSGSGAGEGRSSPEPEGEGEGGRSSGAPSEGGRSGDSSVGSDSSPAEDPPGPARAAPRDACARPLADRPFKVSEGAKEARCRRAAAGGRRGERRVPAGPAPARRPGGRRRAAAGGSPAPPRAPPETRAPPPGAPPAAGPAPGPGAGGVRWGASWSSVVAAGAAPPTPAPLPPIGSDVRRRADAPAPDHSLFYFNGERAPAGYGWQPHDYLPDYGGRSVPPDEGGFGGVWAGGAAGAGGAVGGAGGWGAWGVRPPPGFGPAPRAYDPFRSLADLWAPGTLHWRDPDPAPTPAAAPASPSSRDAPASHARSSHED